MGAGKSKVIEVKVITPKEWFDLAENAHTAVFKEYWNKNLERIDFALLMVKKETDEVVSYATVQIRDSNSAYLQYGGAFPKFQGTPIIFLSFQEMLKTLKKEYKKITTLVENNNYAMLRFYIKEYFKIIGIRYFKNHILLVHQYEAEG